MIKKCLYAHALLKTTKKLYIVHQNRFKILHKVSTNDPNGNEYFRNLLYHTSFRLWVVSFVCQWVMHYHTVSDPHSSPFLRALNLQLAHTHTHTHTTDKHSVMMNNRRSFITSRPCMRSIV